MGSFSVLDDSEKITGFAGQNIFVLKYRAEIKK